MKNTQLLLINDMCGYGKVALSAMLPVLSHMGYRIHNLPTALVSDTLNYPKFYIHDTTEYVRQSLAIWEELGFEFDAISTGFIVTEEEARIISDFCHRRSQKGTKVFVDPIMADNGRLYAGVPESTIGLMRSLVECADYAVPNYTEACLLTDTPMAEQITADEARALVDAMLALGAKSVVITSAKVDGASAVIGYDHVAGEYFTIPFELIPVYFPARAIRSRRCSWVALWPAGAYSVRRPTPCVWWPSLSSAMPTKKTSRRPSHRGLPGCDRP